MLTLFLGKEFNMVHTYKKYIRPIVLCSLILFSVLECSAAKFESKASSLIQIKRIGRTKSKSRITMNNSIIGGWSGSHISLEVTESGAKIEFDCASGTINEKMVLDGKHRFDIPGTYVEEHGGPVMLNEQQKGYSVRYKGSIKSNKMSLTVKRTDNNEIIGIFTLMFRREPNLVKCR